MSPLGIGVTSEFLEDLDVAECTVECT